MNGYLNIVKFLVENGADVTARDNLSLQYASLNEYLDVVQYLLLSGAIPPGEVTVINIQKMGINSEDYEVPFPDVKVAQ